MDHYTQDVSDCLSLRSKFSRCSLGAICWQSCNHRSCDAVGAKIGTQDKIRLWLPFQVSWLLLAIKLQIPRNRHLNFTSNMQTFNQSFPKNLYTNARIRKTQIQIRIEIEIQIELCFSKLSTQHFWVSVSCHFRSLEHRSNSAFSNKYI